MCRCFHLYRVSHKKKKKKRKKSTVSVFDAVYLWEKAIKLKCPTFLWGWFKPVELYNDCKIVWILYKICPEGSKFVFWDWIYKKSTRKCFGLFCFVLFFGGWGSMELLYRGRETITFGLFICGGVWLSVSHLCKYHRINNETDNSMTRE